MILAASRLSCHTRLGTMQSADTGVVSVVDASQHGTALHGTRAAQHSPARPSRTSGYGINR